MTTATGTASLDQLLAPYRADHLGFALATRSRSTSRRVMQRLAVEHKAWQSMQRSDR